VLSRNNHTKSNDEAKFYKKLVIGLYIEVTHLLVALRVNGLCYICNVLVKIDSFRNQKAFLTFLLMQKEVMGLIQMKELLI